MSALTEDQMTDNPVPVKQVMSVPYQLCPLCLGSGYMPIRETTTYVNTCHVCSGAKIIPQCVIPER